MELIIFTTNGHTYKFKNVKNLMPNQPIILNN